MKQKAKKKKRIKFNYRNAIKGFGRLQTDKTHMITVEKGGQEKLYT